MDQPFTNSEFFPTFYELLFIFNYNKLFIQDFHILSKNFYVFSINHDVGIMDNIRRNLRQ